MENNARAFRGASSVGDPSMRSNSQFLPFGRAGLSTMQGNVAVAG